MIRQYSWLLLIYSVLLLGYLIGTHQHKRGRYHGDATKEYLLLFNTITDVENILKNLQSLLIITQQMAEEIYINSDEVSYSPENDDEEILSVQT